MDHLYEELENFFVERLGVKSLTLQMVYDELLQGPEQLRFRFQKARDLILSFNSLLQSEPIPLDPRPLLDANIFPVRFANGAGKFCSAKRDFAIGDRQYLRECFEGQIQVLSFNLEEVRVLSPFFKWAGLERRYLSASVTERTILAENSSRPISMENRDLRRKAYYILRYAAP